MHSRAKSAVLWRVGEHVLTDVRIRARARMAEYMLVLVRALVRICTHILGICVNMHPICQRIDTTAVLACTCVRACVCARICASMQEHACMQLCVCLCARALTSGHECIRCRTHARLFVIARRHSPFALDGQDDTWRMELDLAEAMSSCTTAVAEGEDDHHHHHAQQNQHQHRRPLPASSYTTTYTATYTVSDGGSGSGSVGGKSALSLPTAPTAVARLRGGVGRGRARPWSARDGADEVVSVSYTHLRAHETDSYL
eukprot:6174632-Pleurochrysis_carterae.AAC.3